MKTSLEVLIEFVVEQADQAPLERRIVVYRALAAQIPATNQSHASLMAAADELEQAATKTEQLLLNLRSGR